MEMIFQNNMWAFVIIMLWVLPWKIYSLWTAARRGDKKWFIALVLINSLAILDIIYIFFVAKRTWVDIRRAVTRKF
jgi:hypothetical protein